MARTHLFVDTNVFLNFYSYSKDDLGQLKKLIEHLNTEGISLHLPVHVLNELERNRETKLKASADQFKKESCPTAIPRHMQDYSQAQVYQDAVDSALKARAAMINQAAAEASSKTLAADKVLEDLIGKANIYEDEDAIFERAKQRMQKGNPPGKSGSIGDQYNWEFLLDKVPNVNLHIVSKDGDYSSELNTGRPHPFLEKEWKHKKNSNLHVYNELRPFLDRYLSVLEEEVAADVTLAQEPAPAQEQESDTHESVPIIPPLPQPPVVAPNAEKTAAMDALVQSSSFAASHAAILKLEELRATLSREDAEYLLNAAINNNQISWIASDSDIYAFFSALLNEHTDVDPNLSVAAAEVFGMIPADEDRDPLG
jgi:hypothetical protein